MQIPTNLVCFLHGKKTGPDCEQIQVLSKTAIAKGFQVLSTDFTQTVDPDERLKMLLDVAPKAKERLVLVGMSMGSYAATVASKTLRPQGLFLLSSAFYLSNYSHQNPVPYAHLTALIHGWNDTVVPVENAVRFAKKHKTELHILDTDHFSINALPVIDHIFAGFLDKMDEKV